MTKSLKLFLIRINLIAACAMALPAAAVDRQMLPAEFRHNRVFVVATQPDGQSVEFYTDSGGGVNAIRKSDAERLGLPVRGSMQGEGGKNWPIVDFPPQMKGREIPTPSLKYFEQGRLVAIDDSLIDAAGFLGGRWFADKVWEFDYVGHTLSVLHGWQPPSESKERIALGFRSNLFGQRGMHFARLTVIVDDKPLDLLLDTGATVRLTVASAAQFSLPEGSQVGGSYITRSIFEEWSARHPDWLVVSAGDSMGGREFAMIRVPTVTVAGHKVGPVWFAQRPDSNFRKMMSELMDKPVDGALGGSALQYFRVVIDYPGAAAYFSIP